MRNKLPLLFTLVAVSILALLLAACGGGGEEAGGGSGAEAGKELFAQAVVGTESGCITCHSLTPDEVIVGPSMAGIGSRAGSRVPGLSAEEYLRESILDPNAYLVEGFDPDTMPQVWGDILSEEQIDSLIAYLMTLK